MEDCRNQPKLLRRRPIALFTPLGRLPCPVAPCPSISAAGGSPGRLYIRGPTPRRGRPAKGGLGRCGRPAAERWRCRGVSLASVGQHTPPEQGNSQSGDLHCHRHRHRHSPSAPRPLFLLCFGTVSRFPLSVVVVVVVLVSDRSGSVRSAVLRPSSPSVARMHFSCC